MFDDIERKSDWNLPDGSSYAYEDWIASKEDEMDNACLTIEDMIDELEFVFDDYDEEEDTYYVRCMNWEKKEELPGLCEITGNGTILYSDFPAWINELIQNELACRQ